jgi:hypothetical protein
MAYQILKTDGNLLVTIPDGTISQQFSTIQLPGRNYNGYGQFLDTNFVHLLENFSSANAPLNSLTGQLWFNPTSNVLSLALTDGGPGFSSTWTSIITTDGDPNNPIFNGNVTVNGWLYVTGNSRYDGPMQITNNTAATSTTTGALTVVGGVGIGGNLHVGGEIVGTLSGNVTGNLIVGGSTNSVLYTNSNSVAVGGQYLKYTETTEANLSVQGNITVVPPSLANSIFTIGSNANINSQQMNVAFANGSTFSVQAGTMAFSGPGSFSVSTGANTITLNTTSSNILLQGGFSANSVSQGPVLIQVGGVPAVSMGPNIYSNNAVLTRGNVIVGADVTVTSGAGSTNNSAVLTVYGTNDSNNNSSSGALNVQGGARILANLNVGTGNTTNYAIIRGTDTVNAQSATFLFGLPSYGALQSQGGIGASGNIYSAANISGNSIFSRTGIFAFDTTVDDGQIYRSGSGSSAQMIFAYGSSNTVQPAVLKNSTSSNAATFQYGITTTAIMAGNLSSNGSGFAGTMTGTWTLTAGSNLQATYADLAERFESDYTYDAGTVVELGGDKEITAVREDASENVFGVISNTAAYLMNGAAGNCDTHPAVALAGRVHVKVFGTVKKGDRLVSAGGGYARAAKKGEANSFNTIGRALENKISESAGKVLAAVNAKLS